MQRKPPYSLPTQQTEDCSSEQSPKTNFINSLQHASIVDVWADNFHQQMQKISELTKKYNFIAIDTQFPSIEEYNQKYHYSMNQCEGQKYLRMTKNVDATQVIQLGMCLADQYGNVPSTNFCWQFNFKYEQNIDQVSPQSALLLKKAGIDFEKLRLHGISYKTFIHEFIKSGLLLNKRNRWVVFHGGYDFLYLLKLMRNQASPKTIQEFYKSVKIYFPQKADIKLIIQKQKRLRKHGLSRLSQSILCRRIGRQHQAGSDSLLTLQCYFKLRQQFQHLLQNVVQIENTIFGIGTRDKHEKNFHKDYQHQQYHHHQNYAYYQQQQHYSHHNYQQTHNNSNAYYQNYNYSSYNNHHPQTYQQYENYITSTSQHQQGYTYAEKVKRQEGQKTLQYREKQ